MSIKNSLTSFLLLLKQHRQKNTLPKSNKYSEVRTQRLLPFFDIAYYVHRYSAVTSAEQALQHYLANGLNIQYDPCPYFNSAYYQSQLKKPINNESYLENYLDEGAKLGLDPSPLFNTCFYLSENPDVKLAGMNPLEHFILFGEKEGRLPIDMNTAGLNEKVQQILLQDPANMFALSLTETARLIMQVFDTAYYLRRYAHIIGNENPLLHYLRVGHDTNYDPSPLFDSHYYQAQISTLPKPHTTLLQHYLNTGAAKALDPSPLFSTHYYLQSNLDVACAGVNPLSHFVQWGQHEGRAILSNNWPDLKKCAETLLMKDKANPYAISCLAFYWAIQKKYSIAFQRLDNIKENRLEAINFLFTHLLTHADRLNPEVTVHTYSLAVEKNYLPSQQLRRRLITLCFSQGQTNLAMKTEDFYPSSVNITPMLSIKAYCLSTGAPYQELYPERPIQDIQLKFLDGLPKLTAVAGELYAPPFYLSVLTDCMAFSKCNLLFCDQSLVYDKAAHKNSLHAIFGDCVFGQPIIRARFANQALIELPKLESIEIDSGLMMFGVGSTNYGHWFVEFLPRMLAFDNDTCNTHYPIVIDADMPQTHIDALQLLNKHQRPLIILAPNTKIYFSSLITAPVPAYFPLDVEQGNAYDTVWPRDIFFKLKERILNEMKRLEYPFTKHSGRLFISRRNFTSRQLINEAEIESHLKKWDFETIYPETMTFAEQVMAFQSASIVVGSCSSALTNSIFCNSGSKIIGLIHDYPGFNFRGYTSFIEAGGAEILFVQGNAQNNSPTMHSHHLNYTVSLDAIDRAIAWAMQAVAPKKDCLP